MNGTYKRAQRGVGGARACRVQGPRRPETGIKSIRRFKSRPQEIVLSPPVHRAQGRACAARPVLPWRLAAPFFSLVLGALEGEPVFLRDQSPPWPGGSPDHRVPCVFCLRARLPVARVFYCRMNLCGPLRRVRQVCAVCPKTQPTLSDPLEDALFQLPPWRCAVMREHFQV